MVSADFAHNNGILLLVRMHWTEVDGPINEIGFAVASAASGPGAFSGVAVYEDGQGVVNRLGLSADAGVQWNTVGAKSIALLSSVARTRDSYFWAGLLWQGSGSGRIAGAPGTVGSSTGLVLNAGKRRSVYLTGQTAFPSTVDIAAANPNNAAYWFTAK